EEVYRSLRHAILDAVYPPGVKLVEAEVASALATSRTPVREALHRLELEGLVERSPGTLGVRVVALSRAEVEEIYGVRAVLEGYAARLAAPRTMPADAARLGALLDESERALAAADEAWLLRVNTRFHAAVDALAGSRRLEALIRSLNDQVMRYRAATLAMPGQGRLALGEHRAILAALEAGDAGLAERLVVAHVERKMRDVAAHLSRESR
ncbi:MAG TPA: GntR family transcriptional regulator, partial [Methylomirabilota bacterium]|nr:GntR family transcriptional regulator [Methylomirabilota bacterium]